MSANELLNDRFRDGPPSLKGQNRSCGSIRQQRPGAAFEPRIRPLEADARRPETRADCQPWGASSIMSYVRGHSTWPKAVASRGLRAVHRCSSSPSEPQIASRADTDNPQRGSAVPGGKVAIHVCSAKGLSTPDVNRDSQRPEDLAGIGCTKREGRR